MSYQPREERETVDVVFPYLSDAIIARAESTIRLRELFRIYRESRENELC